MKMFLEKIHSNGLSQLSYIIGHGGRAAVIDPRRDCDIYLDIAARNGAAIRHIFETHRNEDYVIGSTELALKTGAEVYHGQAFDFAYGNPVSAGDTFEFGDLTLEVIEAPGHTYESISIAVADRSFGDDPVAVFSGDALFSGDVGRTDFFPDQAEEVAGLLYDSIFERLLPLGDHVILLPTHGAGSVCGSGQRAIIAASILKQHGFDRVEDSLGSMAACQVSGCPIVKSGVQLLNKDGVIQKVRRMRRFYPPPSVPPTRGGKAEFSWLRGLQLNRKRRG